MRDNHNGTIAANGLVRMASEKFPREILENRDDLGPSSRSLLHDQGSIARIRETLAVGFGHDICLCLCLCLCRGIGIGIGIDPTMIAQGVPRHLEQRLRHHTEAITSKPSHRSLPIEAFPSKPWPRRNSIKNTISKTAMINIAIPNTGRRRTDRKSQISPIW